GPGHRRAIATAAAAPYARPRSRASATFSTIAFWSRSPKASTVRQRYPARCADSANARVETPTITTAPASELGRQIVDRFGVEDPVVALEGAGDARLVELHLEAPDAERAEGDDALALDAVVVGLHALDPERRHGVDVRDDPQAGAAHPRIARHELHARGAGRQPQLRPVLRGGRLRRVGVGPVLDRLADRFPAGRRGRLAVRLITGGDRHPGAEPGQQPRRPRAHGPGAGQHHRP